MLRSREVVERHNPNDLESRPCLGIIEAGRCPNKALDGIDFCILHGGNKALQSKEKEMMYDWARTDFLKKLKNQIPRFTHGPKKYDISEELGITRIMLNEILAKCEDANDLLRYNNQINNLIDKIERLIKSSLKVDEKLSLLISQDDVIKIAQGLVEIMQEYITDPVMMNEIALKFEDIIIVKLGS